jgi:hypothetical protein
MKSLRELKKVDVTFSHFAGRRVTIEARSHLIGILKEIQGRTIAEEASPLWIEANQI